MKKFLLSLVLIICCSVFSKTYATHVMGADLTFLCTGPNTYLITLTVYRDCRGVSLGGPMQVNYSSAQCGVNSSITLNQVGPPVDITPTCFVGTDACNGGSGYGIQKYVFQATLTLPAGCGSDWVLSWSLCCRNNAITTLNNPGNDALYIAADLNNTVPNNSSPTFSTDPIAIYCLNTNYVLQFNHGATVTPGDSLVYSLLPSLTGPGTPVAYNSPYSASNPLGTTAGTTIDPQTGQLSFTPNQTQVAVMKVGVDEYQNGILVAHIERDMQVIVTNCTNTYPTAGGVNGQTGASANTYNTTACSNFCFTIQTEDSSATDSVYYNWVNTSLPGATLTSSGGLKPLLTLCWAPTQSDVGTHNFVLQLRNNDCPYHGTTSIAYTIVVAPSSDPPVVASPDTTLCPGQSVNLNATSAGSVTSYTWSDGANTHSGATWTVAPAHTTVYTVTAIYTNGCQLTDQAVVRMDVPPTVSAFPLLSTLCSTSDTVQLSAFSNDPTATFVWAPAAGLTCTTCANPLASPTASTTYSLMAKDSAGCTSPTVSVTVALAPPPPSQSCSVIYASSTGTGSGTQNNPAGLQAAIDSAACNNALIKMAIGTYTIDNPITNITSYTTLEGGFDPANNWQKTSQPGATIIYRSALNMEGLGTDNARIVAIYMNGNNYFLFQDLTIQTANCPALAATDSSGYSNYVLHLTNCSNYNLVRCQIQPGTATNGRAGYTAPGTGSAPGTPGTGGTGGGGAGTGCNQHGGAGTAGTAASTGASGGGAGGGGNGSGCNFFGCGVNASSGGAGGAGGAGTAGANAPATAPAAPGTTTTFFNVAGQAASGTNGTGGGGGGGGGGGQLGTDCTCSISGNASGGKGGNGGAGGLAGTGGYGGGGCFGIYLFNNGAGGSIVDCNIQANTAGTGGAGGAGQAAGAPTAPTAPGSSSGSCNPQSSGGWGGAGGAGGAGGNGQPGAPGVAAEILSNGTAPAYTAGGAATMITTGINNPAAFNLAAQTVIYAANISCTNRNDTLSSAASGSWTAGTGATTASGTGTQLLTQYTTTGRKDIGYNAFTYIGFVNIAIDQNSFVPTIQSSASVLNGDTFYVCQGSMANFNIAIASADTFEWNFGGATVPNTYTGGRSVQDLTNLSFNTAGTFMILARIETSCCGWSPYDTAYLWVEPQATLSYTGTTSFCPGDSAHIILTGAASSYLWTPTFDLSDSTGTNVYAYPQTNAIYLVTGYSPRQLCNADTSIPVSRTPPATVTFTTVPASCGSNGSATAVPAPPGAYTYIWSTNATTASISNQPSGTYSVTVTPVGSSCSVTAATSIGASGGLQAYMSKSISPLCPGASTGQLKVMAIGGTGPFSYQWSPIPSAIDSLNNLPSGTYSVTITGAGPCTASASQFLGQPLPLSVAVIDSFSPHCAGQCSGSANVDGLGGTGPYSFLWSAPSTSDSSHALNLCVGPYSVTVTDANNCTSIGGVTITAPPHITFDTVSTKSVSCFGGSDGSVTTYISGGTAPYTYVWPQSLTNIDSIATNLAAGTYTSIVTDSFTCRDTLTAVVHQPLPLGATTVVDSISCHGLTDGSITVTGTGGTIPYAYSLDGSVTFQASGYFPGLSSGPHHVEIVDANNCNTTVNFNIFEPTVLSSSIVSTINDSCFNECAGIIVAAGAGGVPPYQYSLNGGSFSLSGTFNGLCASPSYTIDVKDNHGCTTPQLTDPITQPATPLSLALVSANPPSCNNGTDGSFTVNASGGTPGYTYSTDGGPFQASATFAPETIGNHIVTAKDAWGCTAALTVVVPNLPPSSFYTTLDNNVLCFGGSTGSVTLTLTGTTTPYTFSWSPNNANTQNINNIPVGTYIVTVIDGHGCIVYSADSINTITEPAQISTTHTMIPEICFGDSNGCITVTPSGGVQPFSNSWSNGAKISNPCGLKAGSYSDTLTDANGCKFIDANIAVTQPGAIVISNIVAVPVSCIGRSDGSIDLTASGGTPGYTYAWSPASSATPPLTNLTAGTYMVTVYDNHLCTDTATIVVGTVPPMYFNAQKSNVLCPPLHNGLIYIPVTGGTPAYQYNWSNGATTDEISGLDIGAYSVTVLDSRACMIDTSFVIINDSSFHAYPVPSDTATIIEGNELQIGVVSFSNPLGDNAYQYIWTPSRGLSCTDCQDPMAAPVVTTQYRVEVISDSGCIIDTGILITVIPQHQLYVPNAFTPNGNGINDGWTVFGNKKAWKLIDVKVYDRWGEKVFESKDIDFVWDGTYRGQMEEPGLFVYELTVTFIDGHAISNKGSISLIR
jgi:gliding motility-associated-like protein